MILFRGFLIVFLCGLMAGLSHAAEWPACSVVSGTKGGPAIIVNKQTYSPIFISLNNQFNRDDILLEELHKAAEAKFPFFNINLFTAAQTSDEEAAEILDRFCGAYPEGYFLVRTWLGATPEWIQEYPEECITKANGDRMPYASPSSALWRKTIGDLLCQRIGQIIHGSHGHRFLGVCLCYLQTGEWFYNDTNDFMDYSPANLAAFRDWLRKEYKKVRRLQEAWLDPQVTFENAAFPTPEERDAAVWGPFRSPLRHRRAMDMQRFQQDLIADTIAYFAHLVKECTDGRSLAGAFYGYTMELNNNGPRALANSGHLALQSLMENPDLDLFFAPYSYFERGLGQPGHFHSPIDSMALHGKLAIIEEDTYTHLSMEQSPEGLIAPGWADRAKTSEETLSIAQRNIGNFLTHRCGMWFFDLLADGRWNDPMFWASTPLLRRMAAELRGEEPFAPEIACVVDEQSVHYLRASTHPQLLHSLSYWRAELDRIGAPVGYYLQSDLNKLPSSIKVLVMANPYFVSQNDRKQIRRLYNRGGTVIWTYAPGIIGPDGPNPLRIQELTGFPAEPRSDKIPLRIREEFTGDIREIDSTPWDLRFIIPGEQSDVIARYALTNEMAAAAHPAGNGVSIYTTVPRLSAETLREICRRAGVHLYRDSPGMTGVAGQYLIVHTNQKGEYTFSWPKPAIGVIRTAPGSPKGLRLGGDGSLGDLLPANSTAIYRFEAP